MEQAVEQLEQSIGETMEKITVLEAKIRDKLGYYPNNVHPLVLIYRLVKLEQELENCQRDLKMVVKQQQSVGEGVSQKLRENQQLMEQLLELTEFQGDFGIVQEFSNLAAS